MGKIHMTTKIEIDVSERSLEEQIEAACRFASGSRDDIWVRTALEAFAAGKFARAPEPEINKPKWAAYTTWGTRGALFRVEAHASHATSSAVASGPWRDTKRQAVIEFNELFGGVS